LLASEARRAGQGQPGNGAVVIAAAQQLTGDRALGALAGHDAQLERQPVIAGEADMVELREDLRALGLVGPDSVDGMGRRAETRRLRRQRDRGRDQ